MLPPVSKANYGSMKYRSRSKKITQALFQRNKSCIQLLIFLFEEFGKKTSIHGVDRALNAKTSRIRRAMWVFAFSVAFSFLVIVSSILAGRYYRKQYESVIHETRHPAYILPFPEITICNRNRINWANIENAKEAFLRPEHRTPEYEREFEKIVASFDDFRFGLFYVFENLTESYLQKLNYLNIQTLIEYMTWRCHEIFDSCYWRRTRINCCDVFFYRKSTLGLCMSFNSIYSIKGNLKKLMEPKYPFHNSYYGPDSGLNVTVLVRDNLHSPNSLGEKGAKIMLNEPEVWFDFATNIPTNSYARVSIDTVFHFFDDHMRSLTPEERGCLFVDETRSKSFKTLKGITYMFENCQAECQQQHLNIYCNCTMGIFYPPGPYRLCTLTDLPCLAKNNKHFVNFEQDDEKEFLRNEQEGMHCNCLLNCYSVTYITDISTTLLKPEQKRNNTSIVMLNLFYRKNTMLVFKTHLIYTWVDLLVSFGGIAGLCLGCSVISMIEVFYFWLIEVPGILVKELEMKKLQRKLSNVQNNFVKVKQKTLK